MRACVCVLVCAHACVDVCMYLHVYKDECTNVFMHVYTHQDDREESKHVNSDDCEIFVGCGSTAIRMLDSQLREPGFESSCCHFEALAISFIPRCYSSLSCINEYLTEVDI